MVKKVHLTTFRDLRPVLLLSSTSFVSCILDRKLEFLEYLLASSHRDL